MALHIVFFYGLHNHPIHIVYYIILSNVVLLGISIIPHNINVERGEPCGEVDHNKSEAH